MGNYSLNDESTSELTYSQYFNVPNQLVSDVPGALGAGPFREVRLLIDGQVAGTALPYATIFTGR